jgi:hypothetical protein
MAELTMRRPADRGCLEKLREERTYSVTVHLS